MNNPGELTDYAVNTWTEIFLRRCRLAVPAQKGGHVTGFPKLSLFSSGQRRTKRTALRQGLLIRSVIADHAVGSKIGSVLTAAFLPAAHPFPVAPAIGTQP